MDKLNLNFGQLIKNVAVDMYGHNVGDEIRGTVTKPDGGLDVVKPVIVLDKKEIIGGFAYLVAKKSNPDQVGIAQSMVDHSVADCLIYNVREIGSSDPAYAVKDLAQARQEFGF
jgi:hypothetical protein